jgi:hypothetical protein
VFPPTLVSHSPCHEIIQEPTHVPSWLAHSVGLCPMLLKYTLSLLPNPPSRVQPVLSLLTPRPSLVSVLISHQIAFALEDGVWELDSGLVRLRGCRVRMFLERG